MDDLTVVLIGAAAIAAGVLLARKQLPGLSDRTDLGSISPALVQSNGDWRAYLGNYPVGQLPPSRQLAEAQVGAGVFRPGDVEALTTAIEARRYAMAQTPGTHKLYPYLDPSTGRMIDVGWLTQDGQRGPFSYVSYPVGGSPTQGTWRPI